MKTDTPSDESGTQANIVSDPELCLDSPSVVRTKYWHSLEEGRVQCDLCPRLCKLHEGQRGFCFVRGCVDGEIVLTTYGRSSGYCVDPIEKKPLNHFLPGTPALSFGTAGCNLGCKFCQNWDISKSREFDTLADEASPELIASAADRLRCRSVAYTYNDPVVFHEYAIDVAKACRERGIKSVAVTAAQPLDHIGLVIDDKNRTTVLSHVSLLRMSYSVINRGRYGINIERSDEASCRGHLHPITLAPPGYRFSASLSCNSSPRSSQIPLHSVHVSSTMVSFFGL